MSSVRVVVTGATGQVAYALLPRIVSGEMFGDVAGMKLCAAVDRRSVALNDDRQLHCESGSEPPDPKSDTCGDSL